MLNPSRIYCRIDPVIGFWLMASNYTGAAGIGLGKSNRNAPFAKSRDLVRDETWLRSSMRVMAHFAGSSLLGFIDMNIVDVEKTVP